jgi:MFS family permease
MPPPSPWGPVEIIAVIGLTAGTFLVPVLGPLVGLVMAWVSDRWSRKEKVIATALTVAPVFVLAIGLIGLFAASSGSGSSGGPAPTPVISSQTAGGTP